MRMLGLFRRLAQRGQLDFIENLVPLRGANYRGCQYLCARSTLKN